MRSMPISRAPVQYRNLFTAFFDELLRRLNLQWLKLLGRNGKSVHGAQQAVRSGHRAWFLCKMIS